MSTPAIKPDENLAEILIDCERPARAAEARDVE